jgi:hypothetical protein
MWLDGLPTWAVCNVVMSFFVPPCWGVIERFSFLILI